ncbi:MAG: bifunctional oligoribonuclease/PAP phosphatase NrnA [Patescibacteria group bacterium]|nr:bifunctional oligoribonuclease/PAP phosphatase NrnA [Patescibacteria group bacterium]
MKRKKYQKKLNELATIIKKAESIALVTHKNPDGDAMGSTLALKIYLEKIGKKATVFYAGKMDTHLRFLPKYRLGYFKEENFLDDAYIKRENFDLFIVSDAPELKRVGLFSLKNENTLREKLVFIDHHTDRVEEKCLLEIASRKKAATCQIIYDFFEFHKINFGENIATCLLTGLFTDTGGFLHANTTSRIMQLASNLMRKGASLSKIAKKTFSNRKANALKIWGRALARARFNKNSKLVFSYVTEKDLVECGASLEDLSGVTNILGAAEDSTYSLLLTESGRDKIKGSLRSEEYKHCDVSQIAKLFGGGGHKLASGFELKGKIINKTGRPAVA